MSEREEFLKSFNPREAWCADEFWPFQPDCSGAYPNATNKWSYTAQELRWIADELDKRNGVKE